MAPRTRAGWGNTNDDLALTSAEDNAMAHFFTLDSADRIDTLYISSDGEARLGLDSANSPLSMRPGGGSGRPDVRVVRGNGRVKERSSATKVLNETWWDLSKLDEGSAIRAFQGDKPITPELPVRYFYHLPAYENINRRLRQHTINIDLDDYIERVVTVSDVVGEGILFVPTNAVRFAEAVQSSGVFHHDDRANIWGRLAASATVGEGYREISTPSLHVAISDSLCSVHIDSYAFVIHGPDGLTVISPDVPQHILDELFLRKPMPWLRRHWRFGASVLQTLHPVLPTSFNNYAFRFGWRIDLGGSGNLDYARGVPRLRLETTWGPRDRTNRWNHSAELRVASGGDPERDPDWTLTVRVEAGCRDVLCRGDHYSSVGLVLKGKVP
jgi:hypothetical protein